MKIGIEETKNCNNEPITQIVMEPETIEEVSQILRITTGIKAPNEGFSQFYKKGWGWINLPMKKNATYNFSNK